MAILASEIHFYKSGGTGTGTDGAQIVSLGSSITSDKIIDGRVNDLFDDVTSSESASGVIDYRCVYIQNKNNSLTYQTAGIYIDSNAANAKISCAIGLDPAGLNGLAALIADETTAPVGVTFSQPTSQSPLALGNLAPDAYYPLWIRRAVTAGAPAFAGDNFVLGFTGVSDP